jgi:metallothionein
MTQPAQYSKGTVLTCGHEECGCRVRIDEECHCPSEGQTYTCACGEPLVETVETTNSASTMA